MCDAMILLSIIGLIVMIIGLIISYWGISLHRENKKLKSQSEYDNAESNIKGMIIEAESFLALFENYNSKPFDPKKIIQNKFLLEEEIGKNFVSQFLRIFHHWDKLIIKEPTRHEFYGQQELKPVLIELVEKLKSLLSKHTSKKKSN